MNLLTNFSDIILGDFPQTYYHTQTDKKKKKCNVPLVFLQRVWCARQGMMHWTDYAVVSKTSSWEYGLLLLPFTYWIKGAERNSI